MENPQVEILENNAWMPVGTEKDGSYFVFTTKKADFILSCVDRPVPAAPGIVILLIVSGAAFMTILIFIIHTRNTNRRKDKLVK